MFTRRTFLALPIPIVVLAISPFLRLRLRVYDRSEFERVFTGAHIDQVRKTLGHPDVVGAMKNTPVSQTIEESAMSAGVDGPTNPIFTYCKRTRLPGTDPDALVELVFGSDNRVRLIYFPAPVR